MNYLVVGGRGYLGSHLVEQLVENGHQVLNFDNGTGNLQVKFQEGVVDTLGDITNQSDIRKLDSYPKIDGVFHLAAKKSITESITNPSLYRAVNVQGTQNIVDYCRDRAISRIVYTSSAAVYGQKESNHPIDELEQPNPINHYGLTKLQGEKILETAVNRSAISAISLRVFNIVGARKSAFFDKEGENVIPIILRALQSNSVFTVNGGDLNTKDGTCVRDYVNVADVARAHINAMEYLESSTNPRNDLVNISSASGTSIREIIEILNSMLEIKLKWQFGGGRPGDPESVIGNNEHAKRILGWSPTKRIEQSVQESLIAFRNQN